MTNLNIDKSINLLQEVRVLHSLCDNGYNLFCNKHEFQKLLPLKEHFGCNINLGFFPNGESYSSLVNIVHNEPLTEIRGTIKSLIFPKSLIKFCQENNQEKEDKIYFKGLITHKRENSINKLKHTTNKELIISSSNKGREFPLKTFDKDYFNEMKKYKFVLCLDGDFIWSYRFFESIMCGAIPIIENESPLFEGFYYYKIENNLDNITWNEEWVIKNIQLLNKNFTYG